VAALQRGDAGCGAHPHGELLDRDLGGDLTKELGLTFLHTAAYDSANDVDVGFDAVERGVALRD
jgi:hypothetical protein